MPDPGLMPLPDAAADLDWSNLVDAAKAYEGESADELSGTRGTAGPRPVRGCEALVSVSTLLLWTHPPHRVEHLQPETSGANRYRALSRGTR